MNIDFSGDELFVETVVNKLKYYYENYSTVSDDYKLCLYSKNDYLYNISRYVLNLRILNSMMAQKEFNNILVIGSPCIMDIVANDIGLYGNKKITYTDFDLREDFPYKDNSFDLILNLEVLEHIKDRENNGYKKDVFNFSGLDSFMTNNRRVLTDDGLLFLTTPNACSYKNMIKLLQHRKPNRYFYHVREYSYSDLIYMFGKYKFEKIYMESYDISVDDHNSLHSVAFEENMEHINKMMEVAPIYTKNYRGESFYMFLKKDLN